jgi:hypothetical protein
VHDGNLLRIGAGDAVDGGKLTDPKCGNKGADALDASVAIRCICWYDELAAVGLPRCYRGMKEVVTGVEFVHTANPSQAGIRKIVESS